MAIEEFADCSANRVATDVDAVGHAIKQFTVDEWKVFLNWYRGLSDADRALFGVLFAAGFAIFMKVMEGILNKAGIVVAKAVIILLGIAAWTVIFEALAHCADRLDV